MEKLSILILCITLLTACSAKEEQKAVETILLQTSIEESVTDEKPTEKIMNGMVIG